MEVTLFFLFIYCDLWIPIVLLCCFMLLYHVEKLNKFLNSELYIIMGDRLPRSDYLQKKKFPIVATNYSTDFKLRVWTHFIVFVTLLLFTSITIWFQFYGIIGINSFLDLLFPL